MVVCCSMIVFTSCCCCGRRDGNYSKVCLVCAMITSSWTDLRVGACVCVPSTQRAIGKTSLGTTLGLRTGAYSIDRLTLSASDMCPG